MRVFIVSGALAILAGAGTAVAQAPAPAPSPTVRPSPSPSATPTPSARPPAPDPETILESEHANNQPERNADNSAADTRDDQPPKP